MIAPPTPTQTPMIVFWVDLGMPDVWSDESAADVGVDTTVLEDEVTNV